MVKYGPFWEWTSKCQNCERNDSRYTLQLHALCEKIKKILKWQKWSIFNRYNKAKWSKLAYIGDELQNKNIRKTTLEAHSTVLEWYICWVVARFCRQLLRKQLTKLHSVLLFLILKWMNLGNLFGIDSDILLLFLILLILHKVSGSQVPTVLVLGVFHQCVDF